MSVIYALVVFLVFGAAALLMGRSASADWRDGRHRADGASMLFAAQQWWPTLIAATIATVGPIIIVVNGNTP
jgi:hypothetical protein